MSNDDRFMYFAIRTTDDILVVDDHRDPSAGSYQPPPAAACQASWDTTGGEFAIEVRINFAVMGAGVGPGSRVGFTVGAHDGGGGRDAALHWKGPSPSCWQNESDWGDVLLSKRPK
ncbi:MAG: hypothetical protein CME15_09565 [Gemmatimonadetes bacterium]|nr:hypothetical protein [Gemmatimonadota bacterium]